MPTIVIKDFRAGLDLRTFSLSAAVGTIVIGNNGHINQGGEFEKRKAFVRLANTGQLGTSLPVGTFGAQPTLLGVAVFGSQSGVGLTLPAGYIYQQLVHPQVSAGRAAVAMTAIVYSEIFAGKAFAIAQFADGKTFAYYDGVLVDDLISGLVLAYMDASQNDNKPAIAAHLASLLNKSPYYTAIQGAGNFANEFDMFGLPGNNYQPTILIESKTGLTVTLGSSTGYQSAVISNELGTLPPANAALTLGGKVYTFVPLPMVEGDVKIGATVLLTLQNLYNAINHTGTPNTDYICAAANTSVFANNLVSTQKPHFTLTSIQPDVTNEIYNNIAGLSFLLNGQTTLPTNQTKAHGQFSIPAFVASDYAIASVTSAGTLATNASTVTVGGKTYTFVTAAVNNAVANQVKIVAANIPATLQNLVNCINRSGGVVGTDYSTATTANANVTAQYLGSNDIGFQAIALGTAGNSITFVATAGAHFTSGVGTVTFAGGSLGGISSLTVGQVFASGRLTSNGVNVTDGAVITIGSVAYTFKNLPDTDADVLIGATAIESLQNLICAVNYTGTPGVNYIGDSPNPLVSALPSVTNNSMMVRALVGGVAGNGYGTYSTTTALSWGVNGNLTGGLDTIALLPGGGVNFSVWDSRPAAQQVAVAINAYTGTSGFTATTLGNTVFLYTKATNSFYNDAVVTVTTQGQCCIGHGAFQILQSKAGASANISAVTVDGTAITSGAVAWVDTVPNLCQATADNINAFTGTSGFIAVCKGNAVYISRQITRSSDNPSTVVVTLSSTNLGVTEIGLGGLSATATPNYIPFAASGGLVSDTAQIVCSCLVSGGFPPYKYSWNYVSGDNGFTVNNSTSNNVTFHRTESAGAHSSVWNCQVTDSQNAVVISNNVTIYQP